MRGSLVLADRGGIDFRVHAWLAVPRRDVDLSAGSESESLAALELLARAELDVPFEMPEPPLMRLCLVKLANQRRACVWTLHHALLDRASLAAAVSELLETYTTPDDGPVRRLSLTPRATPGLNTEATRFFAELLRGVEAPTTINFGVAHRAGTASCSSSRALAHRLTGPDFVAVERAGRALGVDFETLCEAAFALALSHYCQSTDLLFGASALDDASTRPLCAFAGPLPARVQCEQHRTLGAWLSQVGAQRRERQVHAGASLSEIHGLSELPHDAPLFETCLSVEPRSLYEEVSSRVAAPGLLGLTYQFCSSLPLVLSIAREAHAIALSLTVHPQHLDPETASHFLQHVARLLPLLARANSGTPLSAFDPLSAVERRQLVERWNDTERAYPEHLRLHDLFEAQARKAPDQVALVDARSARTFAELDARANQLAHALIARGVVQGDRVAVCLPRSFDLVATLLAVSKAGASYVPLDRTHPLERIRFTLEDTGARLLVTSETDAADTRSDEELGTPELNLDLDAGFIARCATTAPDCPSSSADEAYVIYTSGSTGNPKGVVVRHRAAANVIDWVNRKFEVGSGDRLLFVTSVCFDLSVYDVFGALGAGASLYVASAEELRDPHKLVQLLESQQITLWDSAPAALSQLVPFLPKK